MNCIRCMGETQARVGHKKFFNVVFRKRECLNCFHTFWTVESYISHNTKFNDESREVMEVLNNYHIRNRNPINNWPEPIIDMEDQS